MGTFVFMSSELESSRNSPSASITRMPKNTVIASGRRKPACTSRSRSEPSSLAFFGARSPTLFTRATSASNDLCSTTWSVRADASSSRRRSIAPARLGSSANAAAATMIDRKTNTSSGSIIALYLDLDDLTDPYVADGLHHHGGHQEHLAHALPEQQVHVIGVDEGQRDTQHRGQRQQHVAGHAPVRGV